MRAAASLPSMVADSRAPVDASYPKYEDPLNPRKGQSHDPGGPTGGGCMSRRRLVAPILSLE